MAAKRSRALVVPVTQSSLPSSTLVTEVYDALMECSRPELAQLVGMLVKLSTTSVLEQLRDQAAKMGLLVEKKSPFQKCGYRVLDWCFSFLDRCDLRAAAVTCRRWHYAQYDGQAGWAASLARQVALTSTWLFEVQARRLKSVSFAAMNHAYVDETSVPVVMPFLSKLTGLKSLMLDRDPIDAASLSSLHNLPLTALHLGGVRSDATIPVLLGLKCAKTLKYLDVTLMDGTNVAGGLQALTALPKLSKLTFYLEEINFTPSVPFASLTELNLEISQAADGPLLFGAPNILPCLTTLSIKWASLSVETIQQLGGFTGLQNLRINECSMPFNEVAFAPLRALTKLTRCTLVAASKRNAILFSNLPNLTELDLTPTRMLGYYPKYMAPLSNLVNLKLRAAGSPLDGLDLENLRILTRLRTLYLDLPPKPLNLGRLRNLTAVTHLFVRDRSRDHVVGTITEALLENGTGSVPFTRIADWNG